MVGGITARIHMIALFELRQELGAEPRAEHADDDQERQRRSMPAIARVAARASGSSA